ncbi:MAG: capsular polysaccharide transport system permease protein [Paracoccaceae bacterium]|jgi:capsular polysaccharide transport system permease protein
MKPKAKKFRIRRAGGPTAPEAGSKPRPEPVQRPAPGVPHQRPEPTTPHQRPQRLSPQEESFLSLREEIDAIKQENLTGRQLRMARREAQKHGLNPSSDLDAVRMLRKNGHNPFKRSDLLELVVSDQGQGPENLPAAIRHAPPPSTHVITPDGRAGEVRKIQLDLARRRRRRLGLLFVKLAFFVFIPTFLAGFYYYRIATPMFATNSEFVIQQADSGAGAAAGLLSGTSFATSQDSITVQSYLNSRAAMLRLDNEFDFKAHFQQAHIDTIQRLDPDGTNEAAYRIYQKRVKIGYDPTEGIIKMEVIAASPEASRIFSEALIVYAEEQVDQMTQRLRGDQMKGARSGFDEAETKMQAAQRRVLELQQKRGVVSIEGEISSRMQQITAREVQLRDRQFELAELMDNPKPNRTKVDIANRSVVRLETEIASMRAELTEGSSGSGSLAVILGELRVAEADLATRQLMLAQSLQQLETARIEANRQVRYLSLGVAPVPPDEATYPRAFENTLLAFLVFGGIYLMASLTASILREQITA